MTKLIEKNKFNNSFQRVKKKITQNRYLLQKIAFTIFLVAIFRLGSLITIPGIVWDDAADTSIFDFLAAIGGGSFKNLSFLAIGISPFITASIMIQLLSTGIIPIIGKWLKQGRKGQTKINYLTKILTIPLGYLQALGLVATTIRLGWLNLSDQFFSEGFYQYFFCPLLLLTGTMVTLLIADLISQKGIGQGTSVVIFVGILALIPGQLIKGLNFIFSESENFLIWIKILSYLIFLVFLVGFIVFFQKIERRVPIQHTGTTLRLKEQEKSYLPIKFNPAGVIPVIFVSTLFSFLQALSQILSNSTSFQNFINEFFSFDTIKGLIVFAFFIILFTLLYSQIAVNSEQLANNLQLSGSYIPGVLPGEDTMKYVSRIVTRMSFFGAFFLAFLSILGPLTNKIVFDEVNLGVSGTSLLILALIGENILNQVRNLKTQMNYVDLPKQKKDIFFWWQD